MLTVCLFIALVTSAQEKRRGRQIEFSDPKGTSSSTNINHLNKSALRELEDDLTKAFHKNLSSYGSLDGVIVPPAQTPGPIQSKKAKELLDRKNNWIFNTPEDLTAGPTAEELLHLPDYATGGKKTKSAMERYYDSLNPKRSRTADKKKDREEEDTVRKRDDSNFFGVEKYDLPNGEDEKQVVAKEKDPNKKNQIFPSYFETKSSDSPVQSVLPSNVSDVFGLGSVSPSVVQTESHKAYIKQYETLLGGSPLTSTGTQLPSSLGGLVDLRAVSPAATDFRNLSIPSPIPAPSSANVFGTPPPILGSVITPVPGFSDITPRPLAPWSQPMMSSRPETPKWTVPGPSSSFNMQRPF